MKVCDICRQKISGISSEGEYFKEVTVKDGDCPPPITPPVEKFEFCFTCWYEKILPYIQEIGGEKCDSGTTELSDSCQQLSSSDSGGNVVL